jgi:hypothetical protein
MQCGGKSAANEASLARREVAVVFNRDLLFSPISSPLAPPEERPDAQGATQGKIPIEIVVKADERHHIFVRKPGPALIVGLLKSQRRRGQAWFYTGDNFGQEFVYPKTRATQLAK